MECSGPMEALVLGLVRAARAHGRAGGTRREGEERRLEAALLDAIADFGSASGAAGEGGRNMTEERRQYSIFEADPINTSTNAEFLAAVKVEAYPPSGSLWRAHLMLRRCLDILDDVRAALEGRESL